MSTTWTLTAGQLATEAYRKLGILPAGGNPDNDQMARAITNINAMITGWQLDGASVTRQTQLQQSIPAGIGYPGNPFIITPTVMGVPAARWAVTTNPLYERVLGPIQYSDYMNYPNKQSTAGTPSSFTWDKQQAATWIYFFPLPQFAGTCTFTTIRTANDVTLSTDTVDIPQEWTEGALWTLADRLMDDEGIAAADPVTAQRIAQHAIAFKEKINSFDRPTSVFFRPYGRPGTSKIWR